MDEHFMGHAEPILHLITVRQVAKDEHCTADLTVFINDGRCTVVNRQLSPVSRQ
jgi:hypothetical protein